MGKYHYDIYIKTKRGEVMTQASNKENKYNVFVISAVFLLGAFLIDKIRTRTLFLIAMCIFTAGTIIGSIANSFNMLLLARLIQGVAAGIMTSLMQTVFMIIFSKEKRGFAMGIVGVVIAFAPAIGPKPSGWIVNNYR